MRHHDAVCRVNGSSMVMQSCSHLPEDVLVPSKDSVAAILQWFESPMLFTRRMKWRHNHLGKYHEFDPVTIEGDPPKVDEVPPSMGIRLFVQRWTVVHVPR
jgi:hypothetical protein